MNWKLPAIPQSAVQVLVIDRPGRLLVMHRSATVRSAPNVWSFPSGLHDIGEMQEDCARRELEEEYGLTDILGITRLGLYENIAGDANAAEQYHWNVSVFAALVPDVEAAVNREPDKHDRMEFVHAHAICDKEFYAEHPFHPSFERWIIPRSQRVFDMMRELAQKDAAACSLSKAQT